MFRKRLVEGASSTNTLQIMTSESGCCGDAQTICKYRIVIDPWVSMASITITKDGEDVIVPLTPAVTDIDLLADGIRAALATEGYILDEDVLDVVITTDGTERTVDIWGEAIIVAVTSSASVVDTATPLCLKQVQCEYTVEVPLGIIAISVDGSADEATNAGGAYETGEAALLKSEIEGSTLLADAQSVTVTENETDETFTVTFRFQRAEVELGGVMATRSNCTQDFVEA
jgi:hypothetical protein